MVSSRAEPAVGGAHGAGRDELDRGGRRQEIDHERPEVDDERALVLEHHRCAEGPWMSSDESLSVTKAPLLLDFIDAVATAFVLDAAAQLGIIDQLARDAQDTSEIARPAQQIRR